MYDCGTLNRQLSVAVRARSRNGDLVAVETLCHLSHLFSAFKSASNASVKFKWHICAIPLIAVSTPPPIKHQQVSLNRRFPYNAVSLTSSDPVQKPHRGFFFGETTVNGSRHRIGVSMTFQNLTQSKRPSLPAGEDGLSRPWIYGSPAQCLGEQPAHLRQMWGDFSDFSLPAPLLPLPKAEIKS